jgi:O-antigen/teichoic acid export membrane protein
MTSETGVLSRPLPRLSVVFARYRFAVAAFDQIALSVFGLALNLCLLRALSATDYGIVSLWMTMALFAGSVQAALATGPLNIHLHAVVDPLAARRLGSAIATINLLTIAAAAAIAAGASLAADGEWAPRDALTMLAVPLFVAAGMYREYHRSMAFSRRDMAMLLWVDGPYLAVTTACLAAIVLWPRHFASLAAAFLAMTIGCLVSQVCVRMRSQSDCRNAEARLFRRGWFRAYRAISGEIAWSLAGVFANHIQSRSYVYIATSFIGVASLAAINAVGLLFRPVSVLVAAWGQAALPQLSAALAGGRISEFDRVLGRALAAAAAGSVLIYAALWVAWPAIARYLLAGKYGDASALLLPWAAASAASVLRYVGSTGLLAAREFRFLAMAQGVCGALAAAATAALIWCDGAAGAMWGIALGNALCFGWEMLRLRGARRRTVANPIEPAELA